MAGLRHIVGEVRRDIAAAHDRDPAARGVSSLEILVAWPGVQALLAHRLAHALDAARVPFAPRVLALVSRAITNIEIHPRATIGDGLFIDHGTGVVIGETAEVGANVTMYQGVTLGGTGFATGKRHPTVEDNVTIGSGAKLLGPITIGHGSKIGANSVVIHDVPPNSTVVGVPGHPVRVEGRRPEGPDADWAHLPDPVADAVKMLSARVAELERQAAEAQGTAAPGRGRPAAPPARPESRRRLSMALRCESTVTVAKPPAEVFPWLLEADKVPRWMTGLEVYEPLEPGPLHVGSRIRQELSVSGQQLRFELHVAELDAARPRRPALRGLRLQGRERVPGAPAGEGAAVTWVISGDTTSFKARLIAPMVQAKLQEKLDVDLGRLRALLAGEAAAASCRLRPGGKLKHAPRRPPACSCSSSSRRPPGRAS